MAILTAEQAFYKACYSELQYRQNKDRDVETAFTKLNSALALFVHGFMTPADDDPSQLAYPIMCREMFLAKVSSLLDTSNFSRLKPEFQLSKEQLIKHYQDMCNLLEMKKSTHPRMILLVNNYLSKCDKALAQLQPSQESYFQSQAYRFYCLRRATEKTVAAEIKSTIAVYGISSSH